MKSSITTTWQGNLAFSSQVGDHAVRTDASTSHGGESSGPSPKMLMMVALTGCTGVDVAAILKKMRVEIKDFTMTVESELTEGVPAVYSAMHLIYEFTGENLDREKLRRAVELSQDKYCGVSAMYRKIMDISWEIRVREPEVEQGGGRG
jgi:putative redox protein